jgi:hypothetical protein
MRNAGLLLGIVAGLVGLLVGFFSAGYTVFVDWISTEVQGADQVFSQVGNVELIRAVSLVSPMLALAGGAMAHSQRWLGGGLMLVSAAGMVLAFGFNVFTMFPVVMAALGGLLVLAAPAPDTPK